MFRFFTSNQFKNTPPKADGLAFFDSLPLINSYRPQLYKRLIGSKSPSLSHLQSSAHIMIGQKVADPLKCGRFLTICGLFTAAYFYFINKSRYSSNELVRIAASGSLTFLACEAAFFPLDSINLQQKCSVNNIGTFQMVK
jgi:hypothetical protein